MNPELILVLVVAALCLAGLVALSLVERASDRAWDRLVEGVVEWRRNGGRL